MPEVKIKTYPNIAQSFGIAGIAVLGILFFQIPIRMVLNRMITNKEATLLICYLLSMGIPLLIVNAIRKNKTGIVSYNFKIKNKRIIPFIVIGALVLLCGIAAPLSGLIPMSEAMKDSIMVRGGHTGVLSFIMMIIAAPVLEELIFRGIILDGLLKKYTPLAAILISSFLFGMVHLNPWQFITGFLLGAFSGWVYWNTRSLLPSIIIHATANSYGFFLKFFIDLKGGDSSVNHSLFERYGGISNFILIIIGAAIILFICIYFLKRQFKKTISTQLKTVTV